MIYEDSFLSKIIQVGTLGYPFSKIVNVLDVEDVKTFKKDFYDKDHQVNIKYNVGLDKADLLIDSKIFEMAKGGDLKALEIYERRKHEYKDQFDDEFKKRNRN